MDYKQNIEKQVESKTAEFIGKGMKIFFFILLGIGIAFLVGYVVMRLWNWLMPELFNLPLISYWQAIGVLVLAKIIFGFGGGNGPSKNKKSNKTPRMSSCNPLRSDFSEWQHYDEFWKEEGEKAYHKYVEQLKKEKSWIGKKETESFWIVLIYSFYRMNLWHKFIQQPTIWRNYNSVVC